MSKASDSHVENVVVPDDRLQRLNAVLSLANLFSNCVETFGLIHPHLDWEKKEQVLLTKLGIQQARLLIWGGILGVPCPPASIATHMIPSQPGLANPTPNDAVYFGARDKRLDDPVLRKKINDALTDVLDRSEHLSRKEMMKQYGLVPSKKGVDEHEQALDRNRLAAFREKRELLIDLAEAHGIPPPKGHSATAHSWQIADLLHFANFIEIIRVRVDALVAMMGLELKVNQALKNDIRLLGWHQTEPKDQAEAVSKLRVIREACGEDHPEYAAAAQQGLDNLEDKWKGLHGYDDIPPVAPKPTAPKSAVSAVRRPSPPSRTSSHSKPSLHVSGMAPSSDKHTDSQAKPKRPGVMNFFRTKSWRKEKEPHLSVVSVDESPRSKSYSLLVSDVMSPLESVRSKSVDAEQEAISLDARFSDDLKLTPIGTVSDDGAKDLSAIATVSDDGKKGALAQMKTISSMISRHDMWQEKFGR